MLSGSKLLKNGRRGWTRTSDPQLRRFSVDYRLTAGALADFNLHSPGNRCYKYRTFRASAHSTHRRVVSPRRDVARRSSLHIPTLRRPVMNKPVQRCLFRFGLILGFALSCTGQTSTSLLSGTIFDNSGAVVAGAMVTALNEATGTTLRQVTNNSGLYAFPSVLAGVYTIELDAPGFKKARATVNTLAVGTPLTVNIPLEIGSSTEVVKVEASVEQINTTNATLGNVVERQTVTDN